MHSSPKAVAGDWHGPRPWLVDNPLTHESTGSCQNNELGELLLEIHLAAVPPFAKEILRCKAGHHPNTLAFTKGQELNSRGRRQ